MAISFVVYVVVVVVFVTNLLNLYRSILLLHKLLSDSNKIK